MLRVRIMLAVAAWIAGSGLCLGQDRVLAIQSTVQVKVVVGVPFSAQAVSESTQVLSDGNRIVHKTTAFIARDSEGRTRREQNPSTGGASVVFIQDPVAGFVYVLETQSHSARKLAISVSATNGPPGDLKRLDRIGGDARATGPDIKSEALGFQMLEGFLAQGTRLTRSLSPGQAGNDRSVEIMSEGWYSDELQTLVMSRTLDPRIGEIAYRLADIHRDEPARSLFEVPSDYAVREMPSGLESPVEKLKND